jgi:phosphate transport system substrate-binding protein
MRAKRITAAALSAFLILSALTVSGCAKTVTKKAEPKQTIRITGSLTCQPLLKTMAAEYKRKHPNVTFLYPTGAHSAAGVQGAKDGTADIGAVSRDLTPAEKALNLKFYLLSEDGLAVATHTGVNLKSITSKQVVGIYSGAITNWKELGGDDKPIIVLDRSEDESAKIILRQYVLGSAPNVSTASVMFLESDMIKALQTTSDSIGYLSYGACVSQSLKLNILKLDGVAPSVSAIHAGKYKMVRPLAILLKSAPAPGTTDFVNWMISKEGKAYMNRKGYASAS